METDDTYKYKILQHHKHQHPDSTRNNNPTQVCANCSKLLETATENDAIFDIEVSKQFNLASPNSATTTTNAYENEFWESNATQKIKVRKILESVYKLHYLDLLPHTDIDLEKVNPANNFGNDSLPISLNENICLCTPCSQVLTSMYKYYLVFNQLRQLNSFLAKKINRLDEMVETHGQRHQRAKRMTSNQPQEDDSLAVIKCEVLMEKGGDEIIFADEEDSHFDDLNDFSQGQYTENEEFDFELNTSHSRENPRARVTVPHIMPADVTVKNLPPINVKNGQQDLGKGNAVLIPGPVPAAPKNAMRSSENLNNSGPWVRLSRLRNVRVGCPVVVSNVNQTTKQYHEFDNLLVVGTERKTRKPNQVENIYLVSSSSGPSDSDDSNDSDFHIEFESMPSKRKRNLPIRSSRKVTNTPKHRNPDKSSNSKTSHTAYPSDDNSKDESVLIRSSDTDPEEEHEPNKGQNPKTKSRSKLKSFTKKKGNKLKSSLAGRDEHREAKRARTRIDKSYRRRKVRVPNPCWHCPLDFPTQEECAAHTKATHFSPGDFFCSKCSKLCPNKNSFSLHQKICESLCPGETRAPYKCSERGCGKEFAFKSTLDTHRSVHISNRNFPCPSPGCSFKGKSTLHTNNHFNRIHVEAEPIYKTGEDGQLIPVVLKCDLCQATFKSEYTRKSHMVKLHTEDGFKKYREQQRAILDRLKEESKIRIAKRSHICPECHVDFLTHLRLVRHRKTVHNVANKFVCDKCGQNFSRVAYLRGHVKYSHTESRPFICEHCGRAFKSGSNLNDHVSHTHTEEGRRKYNELHRSQNQKRKIVAEALAKKSSGIIDYNDSADDNLLTKTETETAVSENTDSVPSYFSSNPNISAAISTSSIMVNTVVPGPSSYCHSSSKMKDSPL